MRVPTSVIHEQFDGEVVVVNMTTGHYFSMAGAANQLWSSIRCGADRAALTGLLGTPDADREVGAFLGLLRAEGLIETDDAEAPAEAGEVESFLGGTALAGSVEKFTDVEGLLLLDPIHEVDEAGWPKTVAKA